MAVLCSVQALHAPIWLSRENAATSWPGVDSKLRQNSKLRLARDGRRGALLDLLCHVGHAHLVRVRVRVRVRARVRARVRVRVRGVQADP